KRVPPQILPTPATQSARPQKPQYAAAGSIAFVVQIPTCCKARRSRQSDTAQCATGSRKGGTPARGPARDKEWTQAPRRSILQELDQHRHDRLTVGRAKSQSPNPVVHRPAKTKA